MLTALTLITVLSVHVFSRESRFKIFVGELFYGAGEVCLGVVDDDCGEG